MIKRGLDKDDSWEGVVTDKRRSSLDGQNMYHRVVVTVSDGNVKEIRVRRSLWNALSPGDRVVKRPGQTSPTQIT